MSNGLARHAADSRVLSYGMHNLKSDKDESRSDSGSPLCGVKSLPTEILVAFEIRYGYHDVIHEFEGTTFSVCGGSMQK